MEDLTAYRDGVYLPKSEIKIGLDDQGFERGFAVFDYCRERNGEIPFLQQHLNRLEEGQTFLRLQKNAAHEEIKQVITTLQNENPIQDSYFKIIISGRILNKEIHPIITIYRDNYKAYVKTSYQNGVTLILQEYAKPFPEIKTTFYLASLREYARMAESNAEDILFYFGDVIRECARCNIFIVKGGLIYTPEKNILKGVTRHHIILCARKEFMVIEKDISVKELFEADEVFISSTTKGIMPINKIEDRLITSGEVGPVTQFLIPEFEIYCNTYVD